MSKLYITHSEWSNDYGGMSFGGKSSRKPPEGFRRLPFNCCALSLQPFEQPVCTKEGQVFDLKCITAYLKKYGVNPVTGEPCSPKDLIHLNFSKNHNGEFHCPITLKVFNHFSHLVAVAKTGNVFTFEAVEKFNIQPKFWKDLVNDEPFTRQDLITIQDPTKLNNRNLSEFHHLRPESAHQFTCTPFFISTLMILSGEGVVEKEPAGINANLTTQKVLAELAKTQQLTKKSVPKDAVPTSGSGSGSVRNRHNESNYTTGIAAASFTSTSLTPITENKRVLLDELEFMYSKVKKRATLKMVTNFGELRLELYADQTPKTAHNFVLLSKKGYYNKIKFHRNIRNFMVTLLIQGGDPTGTGRGGESAWGGDFTDEIRPKLTHNARGILSMANKGPNTNSSQFFIIYRPAPHLNGKHTVFGRITSGLAVLDEMEEVQVDAQDRPVREITIERMEVINDPFEEFDTRFKRKLKHEQDASLPNTHSHKKAKEFSQSTTWLGTEVESTSSTATPAVATTKRSGGIGKYLNSGN